MILGGISALAEYSMLGEAACTTYAIRKDRVSALGLREIPEVPRNEEPACIVQEVGYILPFGDNKAIDPLSLILMLTNEELEDPRVEICKDEMLEELVWLYCTHNSRHIEKWGIHCSDKVDIVPIR